MTTDQAPRELTNEQIDDVFRGLFRTYATKVDKKFARAIIAADRALIASQAQPAAELNPGISVDIAHVTPELHQSTRNLVARFAMALAEKLLVAQKKYGYSDGWADNGWMDECREDLMKHIAKGDPRDVAAYCAFLWHHGESTAIPQQPAAASAEAPFDLNDVVPPSAHDWWLENIRGAASKDWMDGWDACRARARTLAKAAQPIKGQSPPVAPAQQSEAPKL